MEAIFGVLPVIVLFVLIWLTYLNISFAVTIFRAKKKDSSLESCLSTLGKCFFIGLIIVYILSFIICTYLGIVFYLDNDTGLLYYVLNGLTVFSIIVSFLLQQIIYVGHHRMLIGRIQLDYRKIKRVSFPKETKLQFVYGQKNYNTILWFIDDSKLKKALQKAR